MNKEVPLAALLLTAATLTPAAADAREEVALHLSPGLLYSHGWNVYGGDAFGIELSTPFRFGRLGEHSHWPEPFAFGPLVQWQKEPAAQRLMVGAEYVALGIGAEVGFVTRWAHGDTAHGFHAALFGSAGILNLGPRVVVWGAGMEAGLSFSFKIPIRVYGPDALQIISVGGRPWRGTESLMLCGSIRRHARAPVAMPAQLRAVLVRAWLGDALDELVSVATFAQLAEDLSHHGAPSNLPLRARRAAQDERVWWRKLVVVVGAEVISITVCIGDLRFYRAVLAPYLNPGEIAGIDGGRCFETRVGVREARSDSAVPDVGPPSDAAKHGRSPASEIVGVSGANQRITGDPGPKVGAVLRVAEVRQEPFAALRTLNLLKGGRRGDRRDGH